MARKPVDPAPPEKPDTCQPAAPGVNAPLEKEVREEEYKGDGTESSWIEISLVDEAGDAVPGEAYRIELANGQFARGTLDENGYSRHEGIPPGDCRITFPRLDGAAWEPL